MIFEPDYRGISYAWYNMIYQHGKRYHKVYQVGKPIVLNSLTIEKKIVNIIHVYIAPRRL